jgi:hypothetical protein
VAYDKQEIGHEQEFSASVQNGTVTISCYGMFATEGDEVVPEGLTSNLKLKVATLGVATDNPTSLFCA